MNLPGLFVVGTDTGVGKTRVASEIVRALVSGGHRVGVLKPIATGVVRTPSGWRCDDAEQLIDATGGPVPLEDVCPILYEEPLAPTVAARRAGRSLTYADVLDATRRAIGRWQEHAQVIVVEGIGGFLCPLADEATLADLAVSLDFPIIVVARRGLGTLNHTLMTLRAVRFRGLRVAGLVLNSPEPGDETVSERTNAGELARLLPGTAVLAQLPYGEGAALSAEVRAVDWWERAGHPRLTSE